MQRRQLQLVAPFNLFLGYEKKMNISCPFGAEERSLCWKEGNIHILESNIKGSPLFLFRDNVLLHLFLNCWTSCIIKKEEKHNGSTLFKYKSPYHPWVRFKMSRSVKGIRKCNKKCNPHSAVLSAGWVFDPKGSIYHDNLFCLLCLCCSFHLIGVYLNFHDV